MHPRWGGDHCRRSGASAPSLGRRSPRPPEPGAVAHARPLLPPTSVGASRRRGTRSVAEASGTRCLVSDRRPRGVPPQFSWRESGSRPESPCGSPGVRGRGGARRGWAGSSRGVPGLRADLSRRSRLRSAQGAGTAGAGGGGSEVWGPREAARIVRAWARLPQPHIPHFVVSRLHELLERSSCVVIGERPGGKRGGSWGLDLAPEEPGHLHHALWGAPKSQGRQLQALIPGGWWGLQALGAPSTPWGGASCRAAVSSPPAREVLVGPGVWASTWGAGCAGHRHPVTVTGWGTCANEHASGGVGCVLVSGVSSACAQSCWAGTRLFSGPPWGQRHWDVSLPSPPAAR